MLAADRVNEIRDALTTERARVEASLARLAADHAGGAHEDLERSGVEQDIGDRRAVLDQLSTDEQLATTEQRLLTHIDDALARLDAGTYGVCADCGSPIPEERLAALPWAVRCTGCEATHTD